MMIHNIYLLFIIINSILINQTESLNKAILIIKEVDWTIDNEISNDIYYPMQITICNNVLLLSDSEGDFPFKRHSMDFEYLGTLGAWGQGPGEIVKPSWIIGCNNDIVYTYSFMNRSVSMFLTDGRYIGNIDKSLTHQSFYCHVIDNTLILVNTSFNPYAIGVSLNEMYDILSGHDTIVYGDANDVSELLTVSRNRNILLKNSIISSDGENVYAAFRYGSLLLGFTKEGRLLFNTLHPFNVDIPEYSGGEYLGSAPPINKYPEAYVAIDVDDRYIYTIFSGAELSSRDVITGRKTHKIHQGQLLSIHDKRTGEYKYTVELPFLIGDIAVSDDSIYAISTHPEIRLLKFEKPDIFR